MCQIYPSKKHNIDYQYEKIMTQKSKKSLITIFSLLFLPICNLSAQQTEQFKPSGSPEVLIFTDFNNASANGKSVSKFEITRAYFGYKYNFSQFFTGRFTMDFGNPGAGALNYTGYIKYGYLQFHKKDLTVKFGLIQNNMYEMLESYWGSRYIYKSFQGNILEFLQRRFHLYDGCAICSGERGKSFTKLSIMETPRWLQIGYLVNLSELRNQNIVWPELYQLS